MPIGSITTFPLKRPSQKREKNTFEDPMPAGTERWRPGGARIISSAASVPRGTSDLTCGSDHSPIQPNLVAGYSEGREFGMQRRHDQLNRLRANFVNQAGQAFTVKLGGGVIQKQGRPHR